MIIRLRVFEQTLSIVDTRSIPRKGSKDYLVLQFLFSPDWDGLDKLCYLQHGEVSQPIDVVDNLVEVPEWFTQQDSFDVTLFGKGGTQEVPTNVVSLRLEKSNTLWEQNAPEPQPGWLAKVIDLNNHPPIPGDNGYWLIWDTDSGAYVESELPLPAGGSGGTSDHSKLINRDNADQHPMSAVTGLVEALYGKQPTGDYLTQDNLQSATNAALAQAKASGEFDGTDGITPHIGDNGNWYLGDTDTRKPSRGETGSGMDIAGATVGQIAKITAVDDSGKPTAWVAVDMPSGGGHWETVLDTVWEQDVINPTAFDSETGIFTCAEGELNNLALNTEYAFFQQCVVENVAYNTILGNENLKVTKLSDTTFSIDVTPSTTFVPTNVKFSRGACLAITDIDAKKIRLTLDGQFKQTATLYDRPFYGMNVPYFGRNTGYVQIRSAYHAYQQVTAEVESPYRIVGELLCGFNAPSQNASFHFKNNSFCCPLVPAEFSEGDSNFSSDGTKIAKLYSTNNPWHLGGGNENTAILNDLLKIISGTKVKLERWVE